MIPGALTLAPLVLPSAAPVPALTGRVSPGGGRSAHHIAGDVQGARLTYGDLNACAWYVGNTGRDLRGARTMFTRRGLRGVEDSEQRKQ